MKNNYSIKNAIWNDELQLLLKNQDIIANDTKVPRTTC